MSERILLALGVCLPVPLLAATGLSLPLPAGVERLAASLVPFAEAATLEAVDRAAGVPRAVIVRAPTEQRPVEVRGQLIARRGTAANRPARQEAAPAAKTQSRRGARPTKSPAPGKTAPTAPLDAPAGRGEAPQLQPQPSPAPQPVAQPQPESQPAPQPQQPSPAPTPQPPPASPPPPPPVAPPPPPPPPVLPLPLPPPPPLPIPLPPPPPLPLPIGK